MASLVGRSDLHEAFPKAHNHVRGQILPRQTRSHYQQQTPASRTRSVNRDSRYPLDAKRSSDKIRARIYHDGRIRNSAGMVAMVLADPLLSH